MPGNSFYIQAKRRIPFYEKILKMSGKCTVPNIKAARQPSLMFWSTQDLVGSKRGLESQCGAMHRALESEDLDLISSYATALLCDLR